MIVDTVTLFIELMPMGLLQGFVIALVAVGIMIPFRLLDFADLTGEGTYPLGGAVVALLLGQSFSPIVATIGAALIGGGLGLLTAFLHLRLRVNTLLAGIIVATMLYSIDLRVLGRPNLSLFGVDTLFSAVEGSVLGQGGILAAINIAVGGALFAFLRTEKGLAFRAAGLNAKMAESQGIVVSTAIFLGLFLANSCHAFAGALMVQMQQYADVGMGVGIVIHGLAALMIGEALIGTSTLPRQIAAPFVGALLYQQIQGAVMAMGLAPSDFKLLTGLVVVAALACKVWRPFRVRSLGRKNR